MSSSRATGLAPALEASVGRVVGHFASTLAIIGGVVLTAVMMLSVVSITGRWAIGTPIPILNQLGPIPGDFELVEMGTAFAVFSFLGWCQFQRGHVTVDIFVSWLGPKGLAWLSTASNLILTAAAALLAWQHGIGMTDKLNYQESTMILQIPMWWGYAAALIGAWAFVLVSLYTVWRSLNEALGSGEEQGFGE